MDLGNVVEDIKARLDIVEVLAGYIDLKRAGRNFKALCPFHSEKTPSFVVSPDKQIFHCFGCSAGGDLVTFVMKYENMSFPEAVRALADRAGIRIEEAPAGTSAAGNLRKRLLEMHRDACDFYENELRRNARARDYLRKRGLSDGTIDEFSIGFAPAGNVLLGFLKAKGYAESDMIASGLCKETERGRLDTFRNRVVFPISNIRGEVIAFGGRTIADNARGPKYLNSPETLLFKKSSELFGLNLAKAEIRRRGYAIIMEGYLDVITSHQYGVRNSVAPLGTALTDAQAGRLKALTKKVLLVFDSDDAGIKASERSLSLLYEAGFVAKVLLLPKGDDPDTFLRKHGRDAFQRKFRDVLGLVDFFLGLHGERVDIVRSLLLIISKVPDGIIRSDLTREVSEKTGLSEQFLREELNLLRKNPARIRDDGNRSQPMSAERFLLGVYLSYPEYVDLIRESITPGEIEDPEVRGIFEKLYSSSAAVLGEVAHRLDEHELAVATGAAMGINIDSEEVERNIKDCIRTIRNKRLRRRLRDLELEIRIAEKRGEAHLINNLQDQMNLLIKEGGG
ncbi:MAG: DNA primase [Nitrospirae bacterium]|nr:DNA primase [Nitrospirota bacterium]